LALDGGKWSASHPGHFTPGERTPLDTHWTGGWVYPRASLDTVAKRKIPFHAPAKNQTPLVHPKA